jgi:hypothetical protein
MAESLPALEKQRSEIQQKISGFGDMRSGSITTTGIWRVQERLRLAKR